MVQIIDTGGSKSERMGRALGAGLGNALPKFVEKHRLASDLQKVGQMQNASPFEQFSALASIPGITPQMLESGAELLKQQRFRNAYSQGRAPQQGFEQTQGPSIQDVKFGQMPGQIQRNAPQGMQTNLGVPEPGTREEQALANPPSAAEHPGQEKFLPARPWTQEMQDRAITEAFESGKATNLGEATSYANQQRDLYEKAPEAERARYDYKKSIDEETSKLFKSNLETKLQKDAKTFEDVPGEIQLALQKKAQNEVARGNMTPKEAAEYYSTRAFDFVKTLNNAKKLADADVADLINPNKKLERIKSLQVAANEAHELGADEVFYNFLVSRGKDQNGNYRGMGLSLGMASMIQYPISKNLEKIVKDAKFPLFGFDKRQQEAARVADQVLNALSPEDSILTVARQLKDNHPNFDEVAFFDYIRDNPERWSFNKRIGREVQTGVSDVFPNWGDIFLVPAGMKFTPAHRSRK